MATTYVYVDWAKYYHSRRWSATDPKLTLEAAKRAGLEPCPTCYPAATAATSDASSSATPGIGLKRGPSRGARAARGPTQPPTISTRRTGERGRSTGSPGATSSRSNMAGRGSVS